MNTARPNHLQKPSVGTPFRKGQSGNPLGRGLHTQKLNEYRELDKVQKHQLLKETWGEIAFSIMLRVKAFSRTCSPSEFGRLYQLIMSSAVALDKAYPKEPVAVTPQQQIMQVNLFGSISNKAKQVVVPETPVIDVQPTSEATSRSTDNEGNLCVPGDNRDSPVEADGGPGPDQADGQGPQP